MYLLRINLRGGLKLIKNPSPSDLTPLKGNIVSGMDFLKIQYEQGFPLVDSIKKPEDWADIPFYDQDFYKGQIDAVTELVEAADGQVLTIVTLYSAFMESVKTVGKELVAQHLLENPDAYCKGLEIITESILVFINACIDAGVDGFYSSTQGREDFRFEDKKLFDDFIKPLPLLVVCLVKS